IISALKDGKNIEFRGFGTIKKKINKAKQVRNPKSNEKLFKEENYKLHFKIGKILHNKLNTVSEVDE
ncbi:MAG: integration host factor subunit beta, partial [Pelagibacteraceae bacterium]|nr:integration host factor subunit beta [Pelagibacteraceae bacterium]